MHMAYFSGLLDPKVFSSRMKYTTWKNLLQQSKQILRLPLIVNKSSLPLLGMHFIAGETMWWADLQLHTFVLLHSAFNPKDSVHWIDSSQGSLIFATTKYIQKTQLLIKFYVENYL